MEVLYIVALQMPREAAWDRLVSATGFSSPSTHVRVTMTKGNWPEEGAEGYFEFRTPEKIPARTSFTIRESMPGERLSFHLAHGALHGTAMDILVNEPTPGESVVTGIIGGLGNPAHRTKDARGKYLPTPRQRRAETALRGFLDTAMNPVEGITERN